MKKLLLTNFKNTVLFLTALIIVSICPSPSYSAEVLILGNSKLKPVADVINSIDRSIQASMTVRSPKEAVDDLEQIVREENAKVVIALGKEATVYAHTLPESIPVIYGLVINPLETKRKNITGVYMSTPVTEYIDFIKTNLPVIRKIGIICPHSKKKYLDNYAAMPNVEFHEAKNPYEFIGVLQTLSSDVDALLLLPERDLITSKSLEKLYLFSFKENIPVIGISEKYVKVGSLFSLGFDTTEMGRQIGEVANRVLNKGTATGIPHSSPDKLNLYINRGTSETMSVKIPAALMKTAKKVYK